MILEVSGINTFYGSSHILFDLSLSVDRGEVVALLGRNGAGKTTSMRSIMGLTPTRSGQIVFSGLDVAGKPPYERANLGMGFVFDDRRMFPLSVVDNLHLAVKGKGKNRNGGWTVEKVFELFPKLVTLQNNKATSLSGGEQQMLAIARTLMGNPTLLLMDEPAEGLAPIVVQALADQVLKLKEQGVTILVSEQNLSFAMKVADRAYVLEKGDIRYQGTMDELKANDGIKRKYLMV